MERNGSAAEWSSQLGEPLLARNASGGWGLCSRIGVSSKQMHLKYNASRAQGLKFRIGISSKQVPIETQCFWSSGMLLQNGRLL